MTEPLETISTFRNLTLTRHAGNVFIITMHKPPENRLCSWYCQEIIRAFRTVQSVLGPDAEGAVITRGVGEKFWCTVRLFSSPFGILIENELNWVGGGGQN